MIKSYPKALSKQFCEQLIKKFEKVKEKSPLALPGGSMSSIINITHSKYFKDEDKEISEKIIKEIYNKYIEDSPGGLYGKIQDSGYVIQKLSKKESESTLHIDVPEFSACNRFLGIVFFLNTVKGGVMKFSEQKFNYKPKQGDVLMFPPFWTHPHTVSAPTDKDQYILYLYLLLNQ